MGIESRSEISVRNVWEPYLGEKQVFNEGEIIPLFETKRFYVVREGLVAIVDRVGDEQEQERTMRIAKPGRYFGYENFDGESSSQAKALTTEVIVQPIDIDMNDTDAVMALYKLIARTANHQEDRQYFTGDRFAPERIAQALLDTAIPSDDGRRLVVPLIQGEIGRVAHTSRETTNFHLTRFGAKGIIDQQVRSVFVKDVDNLRARANKR